MHECLRQRNDWSRAINLAFFLSLLYYSSFGCAGSLAFGDAVRPSVVQNMKTEPSAHLWRYVAAVAIMIKVQLTAPLLLNACIVSVWPPTAVSQGSVKQRTLEGAASEAMRRLPALMLLSILTGTVALVFAHKVAALASLTGSLLVMVTSVIFPVVVFQRLSRLLDEPMHPRRCFLHGLLLVLGSLMAVAGTIQATHDLQGH